MAIIDLRKNPAKLADKTEQRIDIVDTVFDPSTHKFMCLIRHHKTGQLATLPAESIVVGQPGANLV